MANAAVFAITTDTNDEEVAAVVVCREGAGQTERELVERCQRNMSYFMVPRYIAFNSELPTTVNQKVEKFRLKQEFESNLSSVWDREASGIVLAR